jgi:membrane associated rhomboid family serine protease
MTAMRIRFRGREAMVDERAFESLVRAGLVPEDAWIISPTWTRGHAVQARDLEVFHLWRPELEAETTTPTRRVSILSDIFITRRFSLTSILILANLIVAGVLAIQWGQGYQYALRDWTLQLKGQVGGWWDALHMMPTVFVHANAGHLFGNMLYLFGFGAVVEYCLGWRRTLVLYLLSGYAGSVASYLLLDSPRMSVGASGAIFGLIGATAVILIRHLRDFRFALRWRTRRIFIPLVLAIAVHSLSSGNLWAHAGGLVAGALLALILDRPLPGMAPPPDGTALTDTA